MEVNYYVSFLFVSVEIKACYTFTAHPDSYSPHISKCGPLSSDPLRPSDLSAAAGFDTVLVFLCAAALGVHFEAETERRKLGLPHRVQFLGRTTSEPEYVHSEEVELRGQKHPACQTATFVLQVPDHGAVKEPPRANLTGTNHQIPDVTSPLNCSLAGEYSG